MFSLPLQCYTTGGADRRRSTGGIQEPTTVMSAILLSDEEDLTTDTKSNVSDNEKTKYVSGPPKNYFQMSNDLFNNRRKDNQDNVSKIKTVNTFEMTPGGADVSQITSISSLNISDNLYGRSTVPEHLIRPPGNKVSSIMSIKVNYGSFHGFMIIWNAKVIH